MPISTTADNRTDPAACRGARRLLVVVLGTSLLMAMGLTADLLLRSVYQADEAKIWMRALSLSTPALWPAGSPGRHPETIHPAVDLHFAAGLESVP
jgi:hypothetical protein